MIRNQLKLSILQRAKALTEGTDAGELSTFTAEEILVLAQDLSDQQTELERQSEQLQQAQKALRASRSSFFNLFSNAPVAYLRLEQSGLILESNLAAQKLLGYSATEIHGNFLAHFIYSDDLDIWTRSYKAFFNRPENKTLEIRLTRKKTDILDIEVNGRLVDNQLFHTETGSTSSCLLVNLLEMTRRKNSEDKLKLAAEVFEYSEEGIMIVAADGKIMTVNASFTAITGYEAKDAVGKTPKILKSGRQNSEFYKNMWQHINEEGHWQGEICNRRKNGDLYAEWLSITNVQNIYGKVTRYIGIFSDITRRKLHEQQIEQLAHFDVLTELPNRTLLNDRLNQAIMHASRLKYSLSVLFLDLDHFKALNDSFGHFVGDLFLQDVAKRLKSCLRGSDTVSRIGGDQFIIILTNFKDESSARANTDELANKILAIISSPVDINGKQIVTSASIGCAIYPKDSESVSELIKFADTAMYHVKTQGRNNYQFFSPAMLDAKEGCRLLVNDVQKALLDQQFVVQYQPIVDLLQKNKIIGFEALVRWQHPQHGLVSPEDFIIHTDKEGSIEELGVWVLETACRQLKVWHLQGSDGLTISVNLSVGQLVHNNLVEMVKDVLRKTELAAHFLKLEIKEAFIIENMNEASRNLKTLVRLGCSVTLDNFGSGYSSLTYLKKFPVQTIKIDRSIIRGIDSNRDDKRIVKSIISIGKYMHFKIIAVGIETQVQAKYLVKHGCVAGQGNYYAKPLPAEQITLGLKESI